MENVVSATSVTTAVQVGVVHGGLHLHPAPVVPRQLPAAPGSFTGRVRQLTELDRAVDAAPGSTVVITAIGGAGGIGKTWLAVRWATQRVDRYPDGQLFVDLRGFSPTERPVEPGVAVRGFLDALGVEPGRVPADLDAQTALYRSLVAKRRMLVVLDNAASVEQVAPLLPGDGPATVVVTSRRTLTSLIVRHGARHVDLDVLTDAEAHTLLEHRLGAARVTAEPAAVAELVGLCRGYPLALGILAGRAHADPHLPLAELTADLRELGTAALEDEHHPTASLPAVLSSSYRALSAEQRQVFGLLGIAPGPDTGLPAAASLTGLPERRTGQVLRALLEASVLNRDAHGRYYMHDLIRGYAATSADRDLAPELRQAALRRAVDFYLHSAHTANRRISSHFLSDLQLDPPAAGSVPQPLSDAPSALAWLDREHHCLISAQDTAAAYGWHEDTWRFAGVLDDFHYRRGHRDDRLATWRSALAAVGQLGKPILDALVHTLIGDAYAELGRHDEALRHLRHGLTVAQHHEDQIGQSRAHLGLSWAWTHRGEHRKALEHALRARELARAIKDTLREAYTLSEIAWHLAHLGDYDNAREHCEAALLLHREHGDHDGQAHDLDNLGYIDHHTGRHHDAVTHYRQALGLYRDVGHHWAAANTLEQIGKCHAALESHDQAAVVWGQALELYRVQGRDVEAKRVARLLGGDGQDARMFTEGHRR